MIALLERSNSCQNIPHLEVSPRSPDSPLTLGLLKWYFLHHEVLDCGTSSLALGGRSRTEVHDQVRPPELGRHPEERAPLEQLLQVHHGQGQVHRGGAGAEK